MTISSLSSSATSSLALNGLSKATNQINASTYRLSTGNRFYRAGDDVGSLSIASNMQTRVTGLRQALLNTATANSMLQVAYTGLSEIGDVLDEMRALAVQGTSTSLTAAERATLDAEFQSLRDEVDRIATETSFNGVNLLDGSISGDNAVRTTETSGTQGYATITLTSNLAAGETIILNGVTFTANTDFAIGGSIGATITNFANALNASTNRAISQMNYSDTGGVLGITHKAGGTQGNLFLINDNTSTAAAKMTVSGFLTNAAGMYTTTSGAQNGIYRGATRVSGTVGDNVVNAINQTQGSVTMSFSAIPTNGETFTIDNGNGGTITFTYVAASASTTQITIGTDVNDTIENTIEMLSEYSATDDYVLRQLEYVKNGNSLTIRNQLSGNPATIDGSAVNIAEAIANATVSSATIANGVDQGVNATGINNKDFVGTISGFSATYNSADNVTASITIGSHTYTSTITDTTPAADTFVRFKSTSGGYFDVELNGGTGTTVSNQTNANTYAARLDTAFSTLTFYQSQFVSSYTGTGSLAGSTFEARLDDFSNARIDEISVTAPPAAGQDAVIEFTLNGELFRSQAGLGNSIGAREQVTFTSTTDGNRVLRLNNGDNDIDLSTSTLADTFKDLLRTNFNLGEGDGQLTFQVGTSTTDTIGVTINSATSDSLFNGESVDLSSSTNATTAQTVIDDAIDQLNEMIALVGAGQARIGYAENVINDTITELESARATLADTDVSYESTQYATAVVQQQAAISVLAQAQTLGANLLDLLQG